MMGDRELTVAAAQLPARPLAESGRVCPEICEAIDRAARRQADLVVLGECAYPAYLVRSLENYLAAKVVPGELFVELLTRKAKQHALHIICGFVERIGERLFNTAVCIDGQGGVRGYHRKSFLWSSDVGCYSPGDNLIAFDTPLGRIGILICAEMRSPELAAGLVADGAEMIAVPTCWVMRSDGADQFKNPQAEFLVRARAEEFDVPFVCANKFGYESTSVGYCGRSMIVATGGNTLAESPPDAADVLVAKLSLRPPNLAPIPEDALARLVSEDPPVRAPRGKRGQIKIAVLTPDEGRRWIHADADAADNGLERLRREGVELLIAPELEAAPGDRVRSLAGRSGISVVTDALCASPEIQERASIRFASAQQCRSFAAIRTWAMEGVEIVVMPNSPGGEAMRRARALENRIYVIGAGDRSATVIAPDGRIVAAAPPGGDPVLVCTIDLEESANKDFAPGADVWQQRRVNVFRRALAQCERSLSHGAAHQV